MVSKPKTPSSKKKSSSVPKGNTASAKDTPINEGGRPPKYDAAIHDKSIYEVLASGSFMEHFCKKHDITRQSVHGWRKAHPSFDDAFQRGHVAGHAYWLDLPLLNPKIDISYWNTIMRNTFKLQNPVIEELNGKQTPEEILTIATSYYANGQIAAHTLDRLVNLALSKIKVSVETHRDKNLQKLADALGIQLDS